MPFPKRYWVGHFFIDIDLQKEFPMLQRCPDRKGYWADFSTEAEFGAFIDEARERFDVMVRTGNTPEGPLPMVWLDTKGGRFHQR